MNYINKSLLMLVLLKSKLFQLFCKSKLKIQVYIMLHSVTVKKESGLPLSF
jgi:hypothetical protein